MNLFTKYNRLLLAVLLVGLLSIGFLFYNALNYTLNSKIDENLREELIEAMDYQHVKNIFPAPPEDVDLVIEYKPALKVSRKQYSGDTTFYNPRKKQTEFARYLKADIIFGKSPFHVIILNSKAAQSRQVQIVFWAIIIPVVILFGLLAIFNRYLLMKLWLPFYDILNQIKSFNIMKASYKALKTNISEFQQLDEALQQMTGQIEDDFREIKLFTENASHEMMTPIAIINSKLDTLLQSGTLAENDSNALLDLYKATNRLNKINQSLLLLVKIDHELLGEKVLLKPAELIEQKKDNFKELIDERHIKITCLTDDTTILGNKYQFDILLSNLFSNAIRHNINGGEIRIELKEGELRFENTGSKGELPQGQIFERFYKDPQSDGVGLGLSILKQICIKQGFSLQYTYRPFFHCFEVKFS
ncbi:sensor histidine kinase [Mucilaginibacter terrae]|uniref:histidine kinase n=1 Tax=Mucilaginibacter terrae TaxID=1955052 RepID=A0ABU3GQN9_9SPHI|nr:HAMP domain-containing sensor histidine kinase [Mucilaginibacter terrae]MDT3400970.1 signal transduction histidine kinase [Mucilaginibacter terrae]